MTALLVAIKVYSDCAAVYFPYNEDLVDVMRGIPGREWQKAERRWLIDVEEVDGCAAVFSEEGCTVTVDGELWVPPVMDLPVPSNRVDVIMRLFEIIPDYLIRSTHRALIRAWHPDQGGDHSLTQDLNEVWSRNPKGLT